MNNTSIIKLIAIFAPLLFIKSFTNVIRNNYSEIYNSFYSKLPKPLLSTSPENFPIAASTDKNFTAPKTDNPEQQKMGPLLPKRIFLSQTEESREGFGFAKNYMTLGILFAPQYRLHHYLPMIDFRVSNINNLCKINAYGTSLGFVARYVPRSSCWMWGTNFYWDFRQGSIANWFQLGAGIEVLNKYCDFRINGYLPLEGKRTHTHVFEVGEGLFTKRIKYEFAYSGFNAEIGGKVVRKRDFQIYVAGGTYYIHGECGKKAWGGTFRVRPQYRDIIAVDLSMSDDSIFKLIYKIQVIFSVPLYAIHKKPRTPCEIYERDIYQPVERFNLINLTRGTKCESNF